MKYLERSFSSRPASDDYRANWDAVFRPKKCSGPMGNCQNAATEPHECPYSVEINNNCETCVCCDACVRQCADDI